MERYNYFKAVKSDVLTYITNEISLEEWEDREKLEEYLNETLYFCDSITGNASGSYTFSTWEAEKNLCHNLKLIEEVAFEYGIEPTINSGFEHGAEWWDVSIRCYYLNRAISEVLDEIF